MDRSLLSSNVADGAASRASQEMAQMTSKIWQTFFLIPIMLDLVQDK
jgi:hypothetical protein